MSEYLQNIGRRAELRRELVNQNITIGSHLESLRLTLDPVIEGAELDEAKILSLAAVLAERISEAKEIKAKLTAIEKIIGK